MGVEPTILRLPKPAAYQQALTLKFHKVNEKTPSKVLTLEGVLYLLPLVQGVCPGPE